MLSCIPFRQFRTVNIAVSKIIAGFQRFYTRKIYNILRHTIEMQKKPIKKRHAKTYNTLSFFWWETTRSEVGITNYGAPQWKRVCLRFGTLWYGYTIWITKLKTVHFSNGITKDPFIVIIATVQRLRNLLIVPCAVFFFFLLLLLLLSLLYAFSAKFLFIEIAKQMLQTIIYLAVIHVDVKTRFWR